MKKPLEFTGLHFVNSNTFYNIQRTLILPTINHQFQQCMAIAREKSQNDKVVLGDGRFDSPGKAAKYCTYTCQSPSTKKIVATNTIQTVKGKGSSPLELRAFQNCLQDLDSVGFVVNTVATDRNKQVAKLIRTEHTEIVHNYDPWHFSKNIKSKLRPLAKRKACKIIQEWIKPIGNHLFWCAETVEKIPKN